MPSTVSEALTAVNTFKGSSSSTAWNLDRQVVADRLESLVQDSTLINQGSLNLCGPAAALLLWGKHDPLAFAQYCIQLFEKGEGQIGSITVKPGSDLLNQKYSTVRPRMTVECPQTDWMMMSALRDSSNELLDFEGTPEEDLAGITTPAEIEEWLTATGCYRFVANEGNLAINPGIDHALTLQPGSARDVVMLINTNVLPQAESPPYDLIAQFFPNHFIVLQSPVALQNDEISFEYWSWGNIYPKLTVKKDVFDDNYFGAVIADL